MSTLLQPCSTAKGNFLFEKKLHARGYCCVAGCDEVGRGPLAGPVVAACVTLPPSCDPSPFIDSKKLSHKQRLQLFVLLRKMGATYGVGLVSHKKIDSINILQASLLAMRLAVIDHGRKGSQPDFILVDGKFAIPTAIEQLTLIRGEGKSASIAAASIVAKLHRDTIMETLHRRFPQYNFAGHKGYPTRNHRDAVARYGPSPCHRLTFKGVREFVI